MDEDKSDNVAKTKLEIEIEKHVLSTTVTLSDGTSGTVFTRGPKNESKMFLYNCHLCGVPNLPGERCLQTHIAGRKHQTKLSCSIFDAQLFRSSLLQRNKVQMQIAPGEPVPPGFENEVKPVAELQSVLDKYKDHPLVGLEYVLELTSREEKEPFYCCILCNKRGDPRTILHHITSYNHCIKFLEKHFPTASRELEQYRYNVDARTVVYRIIQSLCQAIEDYHGRLTPDVYDANEYKKNPMKFLQQVINDRHFDEKNGPNFLNIIDHKIIEDTIKLQAMSKNLPKRNPSPPGGRSSGVQKGGRMLGDRLNEDRKSLDSISSISSSSLSRSRSRSPILNRILLLRKRIRNAAPLQPQQRPYDGPPIVQSRSPERFYRRSRSRSRSPVSYRQSRKQSPPSRKAVVRAKLPQTREGMASSIAKHRGKSPNLIEKRQMLPTPKELSQQASEIANERYKWEKFRCMVELAVTELEKSQKEYEKNPEKHPLYSDEWKKFWNRRYKELQAEKKDPTKHDFKPEWIEFWTKRMKELFDENIENKKQEIRKKLGLPEESEEKTDQLKEQYTIPDIHKKKENDKEKEKSQSPIESDDDDVIIEEDVRIPRPLSRNRSSRNSADRVNRSSRNSTDRVSRRSRSPPSYDARSARRSRERISRDRFSPIPKPRSRSREYYREREYYDHPSIVHRRSPPPPQMMRYSESYDEWAKRYYGPTRTRPVYVRSVEYKDDKNDEPLTVVSVLRLLTALEEHLGSLGPKIIDLLAKALALEKVKANSADDLLMNEDNCVIFETVKEKLKGQLIAEVIEAQKINAVKRAIKNIAAVIHMVNEKAKETEKQQRELELEKRNEPFEEKIIIPTLTSSSVDPEVVDKGEIAKKIAASLIAQGKTDITTDQLEVLINTFIEMSKQSKGNKAVSTATFIKDLEIGDSSSHSNITTKSTNSVSDELEKSLERNKRQEEKEDTSNLIESLTDSDLQTLLQNFKNLSSEEQQELILYLKKLESTDPERVEKLRKYVNIGGGIVEKEKKKSMSPPPGQPTPKPFDIFDISDDVDKIIEMNRSPVKRMMHDANEFDIEPADRVDDILAASTKIKMSQYIEDSEDRRNFLDSEDDDDDDYSFDDVLKAASQKVRTGNNNPLMEHEMDEMSQHSVKSLVNDNTSTKSGSGLNISLTDTKNLIATLMGSLQKNVTSRTTQKTNMQQNNLPPVLPQPINQLNPLNTNLNLPFYMQQHQQPAQQHLQVSQQHQQVSQQHQQVSQQHQQAPQLHQQAPQLHQQVQQLHQQATQQMQPNQNMYNAAQQPQYQQAPQQMMQMPSMDMNPSPFDYNQMGRMQNPFEFQQNQMFPSQMMRQQQEQQPQQHQRASHQYTNYHQQQSNLKFLSGRK